MVYHWLPIALNELSPAVRREVARDLHGYIVELTERTD
jgi:hypothetical protein